MIAPIPKDVPLELHQEFLKNMTILTKGTGKLFLFSADHKMEHLDTDFRGPQVPPEVHDPRHLFEIGKNAPIGGMATHLGLIARYGGGYPTIPYVVKLNSKTSLVPLEEKEPFSRVLWSVEDVIVFKRTSQLTVPAIGITVYLGSVYEDLMLEQAARGVFQAHQMGLVTIIWMYPRGTSVPDETDPQLLAGAVGVAACLGADFVKIHAPKASQNTTRSDLLKKIVEAAGTTKVIVAGGSFRTQEELITTLKEDITLAGVSGAAIGRSIFQHTLKEAQDVCQAIAKSIYG